MAWYNFWKKKEPVSFSIQTPTEVQRQDWRNGMWVMTKRGVGIIFHMGNDLLIHLVDPKTGETINAAIESRQGVRQATFKEIPEKRRIGITKEQAEYLGYM